MLEEGEQQLFRHLSVFVGGFTLEAVQAVCFPAASDASSSTQGDQERASSLYQQSLPLLQQAHDRGALGLYLINLGDLWLSQGEEEQAKANYRDGLSLWEEVHRRGAVARTRLDAATFEAGWKAGQTMTEEQTMTEALQDA